ncbi:hypothetical protein Pmani_008056 [Petrolisthes manimaculis]|uniref:Uncharacterized protein n=1 Tax=Petrolisthes manimaculis TaxID=1843537 RepID=A0AAE1UI31_9EUCA|nr:hypothetical protein Pmani_008056 [Petrolisthes manimaculis]
MRREAGEPDDRRRGDGEVIYDDDMRGSLVQLHTHLQYIITSKASRIESCGMIIVVFPVLRRKKSVDMDILHLLKEEDGHGRLQFRRGWAWSSTV